MDGILNIYKEKDFTSHDVVAKLRGICKQRKIGHTGTLDPQAEGVLPVCFGRATKVCDLLTDKHKTYETVLLLGRTTDTQDVFGQTLKEQAVDVTEEEVRKVILSFVGEIEQVPPMYSALKVNGKKLYELARKGIEVERQARPVTIFSIDIKEIKLPRVRMVVSCQKGTYIRTLTHDIGEKLGVGGCMESLLRTKVDRFCLEDSYRLSEVEEMMKAGTLQEAMILPDALFEDCEKAVVDEAYEKRLYNGNELERKAFVKSPSQDTIRVYDKTNCFIGLYEWKKERNAYQPIKMFYPYE